MSIGLACLLTVLIETPFFALCGYRSRTAIAVIVCANVITNLVMNVSLAIFCPQWSMGALAMAEALVIAVEYAVYAVPFGKGWKLFLLTLTANALSCGIGLILMAVN